MKCVVGKLTVLRVQWISSWLTQALYHQNDLGEEAPERVGRERSRRATGERTFGREQRGRERSGENVQGRKRSGENVREGRQGRKRSRGYVCEGQPSGPLYITAMPPI